MTVPLIIFIAVTAVMISASYWDVRSREVSDAHWMAIGVIGMAVSVLTEDLLPGILSAGGFLMFMLFMFSEKVQGKVSLAVIALGSLLLILSSAVSEEPYPLVTLAMVLLFITMYITGAMKGGADVKALAVLSFLFCEYPDYGYAIWEPIYPQSLVLNPMFSVLLIAMILSIVYAIVHNLRRSGGTRISSYITTKAEAESSFVWKLEDIDDENVRVTPMIPFLVPTTVGLVFTMVLGCPLFALI